MGRCVFPVCPCNTTIEDAADRGGSAHRYRKRVLLLGAAAGGGLVLVCEHQGDGGGLIGARADLFLVAIVRRVVSHGPAGRGGSALWTVWGNSSTDNPIGSGVRYGSTPADARTIAGPEPLQSGVTYRVVISRLVCEQAAPCTLELAGDAQFRF